MSEGKGRPTPKRREAEQRRPRVVKAPQNRKEAAALKRELARERREQKRRGRAPRERALPRRDAGPVRAFVRDYVDARRGPGSYFLPATLVIFALGFSGVPALGAASSALLVTLVVVLLVDSRRVGSAVIREVRQRFPDESTRGLRWYAASRSMQIRRWRLPAPRVKQGDPV